MDRISQASSTCVKNHCVVACRDTHTHYKKELKQKYLNKEFTDKLSMDMDTQTLLPSNFERHSQETQQCVLDYITQLSAIEKKACFIARNHLGSSFNILKSNGYNDWLKSRPRL